MIVMKIKYFTQLFLTNLFIVLATSATIAILMTHFLSNYVYEGKVDELKRFGSAMAKEFKKTDNTISIETVEKYQTLLNEFEEKGYQSDYRTTLMLIRENIRKGRGRGRIKQEFYRKKIALPSNIDELIDMANAESEEFREFVGDSADNLVDGIDWLKLAVTARTKKYGDDIPTEQKDKAKQLRFLQYRGFQSDICFAALNYTLDTLDERF